jgi:NAD(P)-dependent dehydrogenase (short-subunit alcohol dehydrogenase family)
MAKAFAEQGMNLALADIDGERLSQVEQELNSSGARIKTYVVDVTDKEAVNQAVTDAFEYFGGIHIVCANAGVSGAMGPLDQAAVEDWDWIIDVNLKGSAYVIQAAMPLLLKHPGNAHIVITSSISGLRVYEPSRGQGMYNTTKYGLVGMGEALKVDLAPHDIGVSILCPGVVNTDLSHSGKNRPKKYGGAIETNDNHELAKAAGSGTDPVQFGRWVVKAIEQNQLYVITHPQDWEQVESRMKKVMAAFDDSENLTET